MQKRILVVEDEAPIREMVAFALRKANLQTSLAEDADQAQKLIATFVPDLILMDWMLPGMSGLELVRVLRKQDLTAAVPIVMLTARGEETDRVHGLEAGVDDYIAKPFSTRELIARIKAVLRRVRG
ncbi:MAG: response regulator, partial [Rhodanobacteraceae bacterium]